MKLRLYVAILAACVLVAGLAVNSVAQSPVSEFDTILAEKLILTDSLTSPDITLSDDLTVTDDLIVNGDSTFQAAAFNGTLLAGETSVGAFDADSIVTTGNVSAVDIAASDQMTVTGGFVGSTGAFSGAITGASFAGQVQATLLNTTEGADLTVTTDGIITPTHTLHALTSAGNVGTASIANGTNGQVLILYNSADTTITITDTGNLKLSGNAALAQYDTLTLFYRNPNWYELAQTDN